MSWFSERRLQQGAVTAMGRKCDRYAADRHRWRTVPRPRPGSVERPRRRDMSAGLRHIFIQSGPGVRSFRRGRLPLELQLFLLQQEVEAHRVLHVRSLKVSTDWCPH